MVKVYNEALCYMPQVWAVHHTTPPQVFVAVTFVHHKNTLPAIMTLASRATLQQYLLAVTFKSPLSFVIDFSSFELCLVQIAVNFCRPAKGWASYGYFRAKNLWNNGDISRYRNSFRYLVFLLFLYWLFSPMCISMWADKAVKEDNRFLCGQTTLAKKVLYRMAQSRTGGIITRIDDAGRHLSKWMPVCRNCPDSSPNHLTQSQRQNTNNFPPFNNGHFFCRACSWMLIAV